MKLMNGMGIERGSKLPIRVKVLELMMRYATGDNKGNDNNGNNRKGGNYIVINNDAVDDDAMDDLQTIFATNNRTVIDENIDDDNNNPPSLQEICNLELIRYID